MSPGLNNVQASDIAHNRHVAPALKARLEIAGYEVRMPRLLTFCGPKPVGHTWQVDVAVVRDLTLPLFVQGCQAVIASHSYGGTIAMIAVEGQSAAD
ncbi:hypothetical protein F5X99DRAFT_405554 [Biscogniauxia marginata]|nr:hypothetical protein F5X99DRAFT_405554 [Biscogniauxia marginata]